MREPKTGDMVVLMQPLPDLGLQWGDVGVIRIADPGPEALYAVEFLPGDVPFDPGILQMPVYVLLAPDQFSLAPGERWDWPGATGDGQYA